MTGRKPFVSVKLAEKSSSLPKVQDSARGAIRPVLMAENSP